MLRDRQNGFTLIELLLAMAFFSFILLFVTSGYIYINRQYVRGLEVRKVHDSNRQVLEMIARDLRLYTPVSICEDPADGCGGNYEICFGSFSYQWSEGEVASASSGIETTISRANGCGLTATDAVPLITDQVSVWDIKIEQLSENTYTVRSAMTSTGEGLSIDSTTNLPACVQVGGSGSQYCDVVVLSTVVDGRAE